MPTVTVDADDLEALLFATSGIKDLEAALDQRRRNPLVKSGEGKLAGAHDRLSTACRRAKREVDWAARVVSEAALAELRRMFQTADGRFRELVVLKEYPMYFAQHLLLVEAGPLWHGFNVEWPAPAAPEFIMRHEGGLAYGARLSHYGRQVLGATESNIVRDGALIGKGAIQPHIDGPAPRLIDA